MLQSYLQLSDGKGVEPDSAGARANLTPPILLQYWQVALRWKWIIAGIILGCVAAGLIITLLITPKYAAVARIEISRDQKRITNVEGVESQEAGRDVEFYQTQYALLDARSIAERVARSLNLAGSDEFFAAHGIDPDGSLSLFGRGSQVSGTERQRRERLAVDVLRAHIGISPIRGSALIDVAYTSASPELSTKIANAWVEQFIAASIDRRFASTADARRFLENRLNELRVRLERSEREVVGYAQQKGIVPLARSKTTDGRTELDRTLVTSDLETLNEALAKATADRLEAEGQLARSEGGANREALTNIAIGEMRQRRAEAAAEYAKLLTQFEPGYPTVKALAEQVRALDASIDREVARVQRSRVQRYNEAVQAETGLRRAVDELKGRMSKQQRDSIQYNIYQREADTNRQLYDGLLQRYKEIGIAGVSANNIAIVDPARVPDRPSSPKLFFNLALSLLAGLALAAGATVALEQIDEGLRDPADVDRVLHLPLLGSVIQTDEPLLALQDAKSSMSEAYLSIRSNLAFSTDHGFPRSLMITSTRSAEGKSTSAFSMATVLGRTGKKVVLIDADMRSPSVQDFVGIPNHAGLSNYLVGNDDWHHLVHAVEVRNLSVMTAGPTPPSAAELLSSDRLAQLIAELSKKFDHVVLDAPPILGLADAPLISNVVEGCVFVIESNGVAVRGARSALDRLRSVNAHIFGVILTKLDRKAIGYGYGYGYGSSYGTPAEA
jgi:capsular exopolysaccharide synthesis family protein